MTPGRTVAPRFVFLEHRWNGVHWDFMLETEPGGALRTWAIDEEVVEGKALRARALADHRSAYLDFEGEVSGGRGSVRRVDRGPYERLEWTEGRVRVRLSGSQLVGMVELSRADGGVGRQGAPAWVFRLGNLD